MGLFSRIFRQTPSITYAITVCNEKDELAALLPQIFRHANKRDQVIVLQDISTLDNDVQNLIEEYGDKILYLQGRLDGDFSKFKNRLIAPAIGDYLFQIDADELPAQYLLKNLGSFLRKYHKIDCFCVPRINIVEGITQSYLNRWNWTQNEDGYVNFPDFQMRLFKLKSKRIRWVNKVHERLDGYDSQMNLPSDNYDFCLIHKKDIKRQVIQNDFYDNLEL